MRSLSRLVVLNRTQRLLCRNTCVVVYVSFLSCSTLFFKIACNQPIHFSWLRPDTIEDTASPPFSSSSIASDTFPISGDNPVTANTAVSTPPALVMELFPQAIFGTSSAQAIVASPTQAVFSPVSGILSPTRAAASVSMHNGRKRSRDHERSSPSELFRSGEERLRTHLEIPPIRGLAAPPVQKAARGGRQTNTVPALPPAASTVSTREFEGSV